MKIAVLGAGAVGSAIGGLLCDSGEDVTLIGRKDHVDAINRDGLFLSGTRGKKVVRIKAAESLDFSPDVSLLAVKTQDVSAVTKRYQAQLAGSTVITLQNGVRSDDMVAAILGEGNIISGVLVFIGVYLEPGKAAYVIAPNRPSLVIGYPFKPEEDKLADYAALLNKAIPTQIVDDIRGAHWTKLLWNLTNAVPALTGLSIQEGYQYPHIRRLNIKLMREGVKVLEKSGIQTIPLPGVPLSQIRAMANRPLFISSFMLKRRTKKMGTVPILGSTLQSVKRGKPTEVDYLNGEIVELGKKSGVPTPANTLVLELVHQIEASGKFLTPAELASKMK